MRRSALYSRSGRVSQPPAAVAPPEPGRLRSALRRVSPSNPKILWSAIGLLALLLALTLSLALKPGPRRLTQEDIDKAVMHTLQNNVLPSAAARAYEKIAPSVVRVVGYGKTKDKNGKESEEETERGVGTGVVIVDKGIILTNLHVVSGAQTIKVTFSDGLESIARDWRAARK